MAGRDLTPPVSTGRCKARFKHSGAGFGLAGLDMPRCDQTGHGKDLKHSGAWFGAVRHEAVTHGIARRDRARHGNARLHHSGVQVKTATAKLVSASPYSQSRHYTVPMLDKESKADFETRTWRERLHVNGEGSVFIPPMSFKNCIAEAAKFLSVTIKGKGKATYTKHFEAGVLVVEPLVLPVKKDDVDGEWLFVPSDGKRGGGSRVDKCFPVIREWTGTVEFLVLDETITKDVFLHHLTEAGKFIGIGRFRPRNNGYYGRFSVAELIWK